jgi:nanoRNase/pAp phosphatase (c-di-AMP/oligoRNAs hydrolase)
MVMEKLEQLREALDDHSQLLIIPHNDPDPDAIASSVGLRYLVAEMFGIEARIRYHGIIGRAENKALVRYLRYPLKKLHPLDFNSGMLVAMIDTQLSAGNNPLPGNLIPKIVIDHHALKDSSLQVHFADVRPEIGASATILTEYLQAAGLDIPTSVATALFYGIKTDTMGLGRGASSADTAAYFYLQPKIDVEALVQIERAQVPVTYFKNLNTALQAARLYDDLVISYLENMRYPDLGAEIADLLLRLSGVKWVICMGVYKDEMILSVRSRSQRVGAGNLAQHIVGDLGSSGGHGTMAGGQIHINQHDPVQLSEQLTKSALDYIKGDTLLVGKPLI